MPILERSQAVSTPRFETAALVRRSSFPNGFTSVSTSAVVVKQMGAAQGADASFVNKFAGYQGLHVPV